MTGNRTEPGGEGRWLLCEKVADELARNGDGCGIPSFRPGDRPGMKEGRGVLR
ncbi:MULTISPECIES: hypothetical protein [unclassified Pseudoclavibacter]|uniref:hypothetical protein n=1 Tax=unclassified Pseudoclavibacter TaxID=2615177 RepID=UPI001BAAA708|nr:hypothetical protein [Pseudoclavibacter sp. Marseille-Q4354]MBS3180026.1 hypothetical protein [Pseudoclavibacter sp. Marseille-Q4354]